MPVNSAQSLQQLASQRGLLRPSRKSELPLRQSDLFDDQARSIRKPSVDTGAVNSAKPTGHVLRKSSSTLFRPPALDGQDVEGPGAGTQGVDGEVQDGEVDGTRATPIVGADITSLDIARLLISCLHVWGVDPALDELCLTKLGLPRPKPSSLSYALVSRDRFLCLFLPGWWSTVSPPTNTMSPNKSAPPTEHPYAQGDNEDVHVPDGHFCATGVDTLKELSLARWQISSTITTQHLLAVSALANTMISLSRVLQADIERSVSIDSVVKHTLHSALEADRGERLLNGGAPESHRANHIQSSTDRLLQMVPLQSTRRLISEPSKGFSAQQSTGLSSENSKGVANEHGPIQGIDHLSEISSEQARTEKEEDVRFGIEEDAASATELRQAWSVLSTFHCVLLVDRMLGSPDYKAPNITLLLQRWQDRCLEIRSAAQTLLLSQLRQMGPAARHAQIDAHAIYLPRYVQPLQQAPDAEVLMQLDDADMRFGMPFIYLLPSLLTQTIFHLFPVTFRFFLSAQIKKYFSRIYFYFL